MQVGLKECWSRGSVLPERPAWAGIGNDSGFRTGLLVTEGSFAYRLAIPEKTARAWRAVRVVGVVDIAGTRPDPYPLAPLIAI